MTLPGMVRALASRWLITLPGLVLSVFLAAVVSHLVPWQFTSSSTVVLVQPRLYDKGSSGSNPLLNFDTSLSTTALILVQGLGAKAAEAQLGMYPGSTESYTIDDVTDGGSSSSGAAGGGSQFVQPFIYVTSKSATPVGAVTMVQRVIDEAAQDLADRQRSMRVTSHNELTLESVVGAAEPKIALGQPLAAIAATFVFGCCLTVLVALLRHRRVTRRARVRARARALALVGTERPGPEERSGEPAVGHPVHATNGAVPAAGVTT